MWNTRCFTECVNDSLETMTLGQFHTNTKKERENLDDMYLDSVNINCFIYRRRVMIHVLQSANIVSYTG